MDLFVAEERLKALTDEWLGTPFEIGGRGREGLDCFGWWVEAWSALGAAVPDPVAEFQRKSGRVDVLRDLIAIFEESLPKADPRELQTGDALVLERYSEHANHVAIILDRWWSAHAVRGIGVARVRTANLVRYGRVWGAFRCPTLL